MRNTKQKELILNVINNSYTHPTAEEIYLKCQRKISNISLGTVYRNLNQLVNLNIIQIIKMPDNINRYDKLDEHIHFICIKCNKVLDISKNIEFDYRQLVGDNEVINCKISFEGICKECQNKKGE